MAQRSKSGEWLQLWLFRVRRWLLSRNGYLMLTISFVGVIVFWINVNFSSTVFVKTTQHSQDESMYPYFVEDMIFKEPSPAEIERRRRVAVFSRILQKQVRKQRRGQNETRCIHPKLDLKYDANQFAYRDLSPLNCTGNGFFFSRKGVLVLNKSVITAPSLLGKCLFYHIKRISDDAYSYAAPDAKESPPFEISVPHDFLRISCVLNSTLEEYQEAYSMDPAYDGLFGNGEYEQGNHKRRLLNENHNNSSVSEMGTDHNKSEDVGQSFIDYYNEWAGNFMGDEEFVSPDTMIRDYDQFLVQVHPQPEVFQRISKVQSTLPSGDPMRLNVLMFALDSMSHMTYQRKLPTTYRFLKDKLGAAILENYNIVGDATTAAIIPMLTGKTEMDLPEVRSSNLEGGMVDEYPLIWKNFRDCGYVTLFAEDEPSLSTFNLRLNGFQEPPTDHYMRPFWQALWDSNLQQSSERFCAGDIAHHQFMLNYLEDFFVKYHNVSRFAFGFHGELTHNDNNPAQYIDADLVSFLKRLRQAKMLENTVLIIFGDHGARYSKVRNTVQGKLEERLPLMSLVFPKKFSQQYPQLYHNLMTNTQRLSTPFDIYETLLDIVNLSRTSQSVSSSLGISLLREIPAERTCQEAGISMHWCSCLHQVSVDPGEEFVKPAALTLMWHLNVQTDAHRHQCANLELEKVLSVHMVIPNEQVLRFRKSKDQDQREANFSREIDLDMVHYQLQVKTQPCGALFEATVMGDFRNYSAYKFTVTPGISRINKYSSQPLCVQDRYPALRKFCCCLDYLKEQESSVSMKPKEDRTLPEGKV